MATITIPPETCTIGSEMPKKCRITVPSSSMITRKMTLLIAIFRASERYVSAGASPTRPRKTSAVPSGLMSGSSALNAMRNDSQSSSAACTGPMVAGTPASQGRRANLG